MSGIAPSFDLRFIDSPFGILPCIVRGPQDGPQLLVLQPLFEEMNRSRRLLADVTRLLAARGIGSRLFDLPGTGDSPLRTDQADWETWRAAVRFMSDDLSASYGNHFILSVRGGTLLDDAVAAVPAYRVAPVASGARLLRELMRTRVAAEAERGTAIGIRDIEADFAAGQTVELGGYAVTSALAESLGRAALAEPGPRHRTADLADGAADIRLDGPPVWRQAEPLPASALAAALAADIAAWIG